MIVSADWLAQYTTLPGSVEELTERLTLAGLNLEQFHEVALEGGFRDTAIDLEVTSNRPDCLGHVGVAREVAVLFRSELRVPDPRPDERGPASASRVRVSIKADDLCPRYTARLLRGVRVGPSPKWLADRLHAIGIATINNVVDVTNYVMMEIGQPLHAFDFARLAGGEIVVRRARAGEPFKAIDHRDYTLSADELVIADAERAVAMAGVMGGAETEVSDATTDVLIESGVFDPLAVRASARRHALHSPSSYRFERGVDPEAVDWASRRACSLILELAGGELCVGVVEAGSKPPAPTEIKLRFERLAAVLGVSIEPDAARDALVALGCRLTHECGRCLKVVPPTWRADLSREADLIEEVIRIVGYDKIPSRVGLLVAPSARGRDETVIARVRGVLTGEGFDEAFTLSAVEPDAVEAFRPWTDAPPLATATPVLRRADRLRQSLAPSLLTCRRTNESLSNPDADLFEIAKAYLPGAASPPEEKLLLSVVTGAGFLELKGVLEAIVAEIAPRRAIGASRSELPLLAAGRQAELSLEGPDGEHARWGYLGELSPAGLRRMGLRSAATIAEVALGELIEAAEMIPLARPLSPFPPVTRDLNIVLPAAAPWAGVERATRAAAAELLERVTFLDDSFRDATQIGAGMKSVVFRMHLRSIEGTLTSDQADAAVARVVAEIAKQLGGKLRE